MRQLTVCLVVPVHGLLVPFPTSGILCKLFSLIFVPQAMGQEECLVEVTNLMLPLFYFGGNSSPQISSRDTEVPDSASTSVTRIVLEEEAA